MDQRLIENFECGGTTGPVQRGTKRRVAGRGSIHPGEVEGGVGYGIV